MTKKELADMAEGLAEQIAERFGATIVEKTITVGGRKTVSRVADGGLLDLNASRNVLVSAFREYRDTLIQHMPGRRSTAAPDGSGPRIGPDSQIYVGTGDGAAVLS